MQVTDKQAFVIARALYKGINTGENDVQFSVWGDGAATIGVKRKRGKFMLYIALNDKREKGIRFPLFAKNIDIQELADNIQQAIEESVFLEDKDLDTSRRVFQDIESTPKEIESIKELPEDKSSELDNDLSESYTLESDFDDLHIDFTDESFEDDPQGFEEDNTTNYEEDATLDSEEDALSPEPIPAQNAGFDIAGYMTDSSLQGSIMQKSRRIAELIASWTHGSEKPLQGKEKDLFISFLDALIQALLFSDMTQEEVILRTESFYMKDVFDFVMRNDLDDIESYFKKLPTSHLAFTSYRLFSYADNDIKSSIMQNLILRLTDYATVEFDSLFNNIYKEMAATNEEEEKAMERKEEMNNNMDNVFDHSLESNGEANVYYALDETQPEPAVNDTKEVSQLQKQICSRAEDFAKEMNTVFLSIIENEPEQAEKLYLVAIAVALKATNGDAMALANKINSDARDIIMADYEYQIRKKELQAAI